MRNEEDQDGADGVSERSGAAVEGCGEAEKLAMITGDLTPTNPDRAFIDPNTGQKIFAAEYDFAGRTFVFHFWANNFEDAEWHLRYIRQGAKLIGQVFKSEDMGGVQ